MPLTEEQVVSLVLRKMTGGLSEEDILLLNKWAGESEHNAEQLARFSDWNWLRQKLQAYSQIASAPPLRETGALAQPVVPVTGTAPAKMRSLRRWGWAAAMLVALGFALYQWTGGRYRQDMLADNTLPVAKDIGPGREGAILTLANGSQVLLDSVRQGVVATQGGASVVWKNGLLAYETGGAAAEANIYHTIQTPKGRQVKVVLSDGTLVWLNSASSLKYPASFPPKERSIEITGEAYVEVSKDSYRPFRAMAAGVQVDVLGTAFNINAYRDDGTVSATLINGSVRVSGANTPVLLLKPGEQAQSNASGHIDLNRHPDLEQITAWQKGLFDFNDRTLQQVLMQVGRWYDVEIVYEKEIPRIEFEGKVSRDSNLSELLLILKKSGVRTRLEGRKLIVL